MYDKRGEKQKSKHVWEIMQKNDHVHMLYPLLYETKKEKKVTLFMGPKRKKIKLCLDGPAK